VIDRCTACHARAGASMRNTITVMNAKSGVGKSTLELALAETLATYQDKSILVIDADAQASVSHLLVRQRLNQHNPVVGR
jgi:cellulose biosynthesis protein BcsQ